MVHPIRYVSRTIFWFVHIHTNVHTLKIISTLAVAAHKQKRTESMQSMNDASAVCPNLSRVIVMFDLVNSKLTVSCPSFVDHLSQLAPKLVHSFRKYQFTIWQRMCWLQLSSVLQSTGFYPAVQAFSYAGPSAWNSLPAHLRSQNVTINNFRHSLKTFLFSQMIHAAH